jgi:FSR family fosmidomycin resistance protein-like MFS transporter
MDRPFLIPIPYLVLSLQKGNLMWTTLRRSSWFVVLLLAIEWLDEVVFGLGQAALPLIRDDLSLSYWQIGLLMAIPTWIASVIELFLGVLGDSHHRRRVILCGGLGFGVALAFTGLSQSFGVLLAATVLFFPSSGAFVSLSQASLMDYAPTRHEQNMARWELAGSLGVLGGSLLLGASLGLGLGWREPYFLLAALAFGLWLWAWRYPFSAHLEVSSEEEDEETEASPFSLWEGLKTALSALRRREVVYWLTLLQVSNLMLDVFLGYLALYCVDVVGVSEAEAAVLQG